MNNESFPLYSSDKKGWPFDIESLPDQNQSDISWPKISIVTPSFNQGQYIEQTIRSVLLQNYPNLEYIIFDGGSTDETVSIIKKYEPWLTYWVSEPDRGQSHAINKGLKKCTGNYFNWINSDDYLEKGALQAISNYVSVNPDVNIICGYTNCFWNDDNRPSHEYRMGLKSNVADNILHVEMNQPGTFYRTEILRKFGGVNESLRYVFDDELWFRYLCAFGMQNIGLINDRIAHFRLHSNSKSVLEGYPLFNQELQAIYFQILKEIGSAEWLLELQSKEIMSHEYNSSKPWELHYLERSKFLAFFARKFITTLYNSGSIKAAKEAMRLIKENGYFCWSRMHLSLAVKLLFQ